MIAHLTDPGALDAALRGLDLVHPGKNDARIDVSVHRYTDDSGRRILFVASPSDEEISARVNLDVDLESVTDI